MSRARFRNRRTVPLLLGVITWGAVELSATGLDAALDQYLTVREHPPVDSALPAGAYHGLVSLHLDRIGNSGVSVHAAGSYTNAFGDSLRRRLECSGLYVDLDSLPGPLTLRVGRQWLYESVAREQYTDAVKLSLDLSKRMTVTSFAGMTSPPRYSGEEPWPVGSRFVGGLGVRTRLHERLVTELGAEALGRHGAGVDPFLRGSAHARLGTNTRLFGEIAVDLSRAVVRRGTLHLRMRPLAALEIAPYVVRRAVRVDSSNFYEVLFLDDYSEAGVSAGVYPASDMHIHGDYGIRVFDGGVDHVGEVQAGMRGMFVAGRMVSGMHGSHVALTPGARILLRESLAVRADGGWNTFARGGETAWEHGGEGRAMLEWVLPWWTAGFRCVVEPGVEYLTNAYYRHDLTVRLRVRNRYSRWWPSEEAAR